MLDMIEISLWDYPIISMNYRLLPCAEYQGKGWWVDDIETHTRCLGREMLCETRLHPEVAFKVCLEITPAVLWSLIWRAGSKMGQYKETTFLYHVVGWKGLLGKLSPSVCFQEAISVKVVVPRPRELPSHHLMSAKRSNLESTNQRRRQLMTTICRPRVCT